MTYNQIPEHALIRALVYLKVEKYPSNLSIITFGDLSDKFYIIVKGSVIIKEIKVKDEENIVADKLTLTEGSTFGEFGILYNTTRLQTVVSLTPVTLITLSKEVFKKYIIQYISNAERERRIQICILLPFFNQISYDSFILNYCNFVFYKVEKLKFVFHEGDKADSIFIIMQGRCRLTRNGRTLMTLGRNCIAGLEAVEFRERNADVFYSNSLFAIDNLILIKIRMNHLGQYNKQFRLSLKELKKTKDDLMKDLIIGNKRQKQKYHINYREQVMKNNLKTSLMPILTDKESKEIDEQIQIYYKNGLEATTFKKVHSYKTIISHKRLIIPKIIINNKQHNRNNMIKTYDSSSTTNKKSKLKMKTVNETTYALNTFMTKIKGSSPQNMKMKLWSNEVSQPSEDDRMNSLHIGSNTRSAVNVLSKIDMTKLKLGRKENNKQLIGEQINNNLTTWSNALISKQYNTGQYKMPLACLTKREDSKGSCR